MGTLKIGQERAFNCFWTDECTNDWYFVNGVDSETWFIVLEFLFEEFEGIRVLHSNQILNIINSYDPRF